MQTCECCNIEQTPDLMLAFFLLALMLLRFEPARSMVAWFMFKLIEVLYVPSLHNHNIEDAPSLLAFIW